MSKEHPMKFPAFTRFNLLDAAIELCVIFLIIFTPLVFGSVGIGSQIIFTFVCQLMFLLWLAKSFKTGQIRIIGNPFFYLYIAFLCLIIFQLIPLPKFILKILSPATYKNYIEFLPGYREGFMWRAISVHTQATRIEFLKALSYGLLVFAIINNFNRKSQILHILTAVSITGFAIACFGIIQKVTYNGMIYWVQPVPENAIPFGPFVNKNHFAGFMELTIPTTFALIFVAKRIEKKAFLAFMATVMLLALFLCLSRAGIMSFLAAALFVLFLLFLRHSLVKYMKYILPAVLLICVTMFLITKAPVMERFSAAPEAFSLRLAVYKDAFRMFFDFPLFGVGAGNFASIFGMYKTSGADVVFRHAESDWVQFLTETGVAGFLCIAAFIWLFFKDILYCHFLGRGRCLFSKDFHKRHDRFVLLFLSAGLVSLVSITFHGILDINLHIPSNAVLASVIAGILIAVAHNRFHDESDKTI